MSYVKGIAQAAFIVTGTTAATVAAVLANDEVIKNKKLSNTFKDTFVLVSPYVSSAAGYVVSDVLSTKMLNTSSYIGRSFEALKVMYKA